MDNDAKQTKRSRAAPPSRSYVFTLNNPLDDAKDKLESAFKDVDSAVRYAIWQGETGEQGTPHLQGYIEFTRPVRLPHCAVLIPRAHFEPRRGTREQAIAYCSKQETRTCGPYEFGESRAGGQGKRNDLLSLKTAIDHGATEKEIADLDFGAWCRNYRAFERYRRLQSTQTDRPISVEVLIGPPGSGKSRSALARYPGAYWKPRGLWWDGYERQTVVVIDEYYGWLPWDTLLRILDRYPLILETKGGGVNYQATHVVITTNRSPRQWYKPSLPFEALHRRVSTWTYHLRDGDAFLSFEYPTLDALETKHDPTFKGWRDPDPKFD